MSDKKIDFSKMRVVAFGHDDTTEPEKEGLEMADDVAKLALKSKSDKDFIRRRNAATRIFADACGVSVCNEKKHSSHRNKGVGREPAWYTPPLIDMVNTIRRGNRTSTAKEVFEALTGVRAVYPILRIDGNAEEIEITESITAKQNGRDIIIAGRVHPQSVKTFENWMSTHNGQIISKV